MELNILLCGVVILMCILSGRFTDKYGVPSILLFILIGMLFGVEGILKISFSDFALSEKICTTALIFIMFYGGFGTSWKMAKPILPKAVLLSTAGVVLTAGLCTLFSYGVLRLSLETSLLLGAVISSTDAASVFSILRSRNLSLKYGTASILEVESGSNDPFSYMLTMIVLQILAGSSVNVPLLLAEQILIGGLCGAFMGKLTGYLMKKAEFTQEGMEIILMIALVLLTYAVPVLLHGNGFLSVYLMGMITGNQKFKSKIKLVHFFNGADRLAQILIFFLLGLLVTPSRLLPVLFPAVGLFLGLTFLVRPIVVAILMTPLRAPLNQQLLISAAGLRGAASIVFAISVTVSDAYVKDDIFHMIFCIAMISVALQGILLPVLAKKLDMVDENQNVLKTFSDYQEEQQLPLLQITLTAGHRFVGRKISELKLWDLLVVMIKREGKALLPRGNVTLQEGDVLVLSGESYQEDTAAYLDERLIEEGHPWIGKSLAELSDTLKSLIVMIQRSDGELAVPKGDTRIEVGDLLVFTKPGLKESTQSVQVGKIDE